jgi:hypothetical protein
MGSLIRLLFAPRELNSSHCGAAQSTIARKEEKINPTFANMRHAPR